MADEAHTRGMPSTRDMLWLLETGSDDDIIRTCRLLAHGPTLPASLRADILDMLDILADVVDDDSDLDHAITRARDAIAA